MKKIDTREFEGLRLKVYTDTTGHQTIGYGHNLDGGSNDNLEAIGLNPKQLKQGKTITLKQAENLYQLDMADAKRDVETLIPRLDTYPQIVQDILLDLCFNMGLNTLSTFKHTLQNIKNRNYSLAAYSLKQSKWYKQVGNRSKIIVQTLLELRDDQEE